MIPSHKNEQKVTSNLSYTKFFPALTQHRKIEWIHIRLCDWVWSSASNKLHIEIRQWKTTWVVLFRLNRSQGTQAAHLSLSWGDNPWSNKIPLAIHLHLQVNRRIQLSFGPPFLKNSIALIFTCSHRSGSWLLCMLTKYFLRVTA